MISGLPILEVRSASDSLSDDYVVKLVDYLKGIMPTLNAGGAGAWGAGETQRQR